MTNDLSYASEAVDRYLLGTDEAARLLRGAPWARFVTVGDSGAEGVTEPLPGYRTMPWFDRFTEHLRLVQPALVARNFGKRNLFAADVRATQLEPALDFEPDLAAVLSGGNDILKKVFDVEATRAEIVTVVSALAKTGATIVTMGLFDITNSPHVEERYRKVMSERIALLSETVRGIAEEYGALHVDLPAHPAGTEGIYSSDGLHLNARGQAIVADETVRRLGRHLAAG